MRPFLLLIFLGGCGLIDPIDALEKDDDASVADGPADTTTTPDVVDASTIDAAMDAPTDVIVDVSVETGPPCGTQNPCTNVTSFGCYCGASTEHGFDPNKAVSACLYDCQAGGVIKSSAKCSVGCIVEGSATADQCTTGGTCGDV